MDLITIGSFLLGMGLGFLYLLTVIRLANGLRKIHNVPVFHPIVEGSLCPDKGLHHDWKGINLKTYGDPEIAQAMVCAECGVVCGKDRQFDVKSLEIVLEKSRHS